MHDLSESFRIAFGLIASLDRDLAEIVALSLRVSLTAVAIACALGLPLGAALGMARFPGRGALIVLLNALMGLPPVAVGLLVYLLLSSSGPLGALRLLYTPSAMIVAQTILVTPIVAALSRQVVEDLHAEYAEQLRSPPSPRSSGTRAPACSPSPSRASGGRSPKWGRCSSSAGTSST